MASLGEIAALHKSGRYDLARLRCLEFIKASPDDAEAHYLLALIEYRLGAPVAAAEAARRASALAPQQATYWNALGAALAGAGRAREAIGAFERANALEPRVVSTMANLGNALLDAGRFDDALAVFDRAIELARSDYRLSISRGMALHAKSDFQAALAELDRKSVV